MLQSVVSLVPRTLWHIMSVPDGAVDWKWLVELPSSIPKIIENSGNVTVTGEDNGGGLISGIIDVVSDVAASITDTFGAVLDQISTTALMMRAQSVQVPHEQISSVTVRTQARLRNFADSIQLSNLVITFYEDYNYSALSYLQNWRKAIVNDYGVFRCPNGEDGYAKTIRVHVFDTVGIKKGCFVFYNCYPEQIDTYEYGNGQNPGIIHTSCSFSTSRMTFEPTGLLNTGGLGSTAQALVGNITGESFVRDTFNNIVGGS